jgi:hypothetical protein
MATLPSRSGKVRETVQASQMPAARASAVKVRTRSLSRRRINAPS